MENKKTKLTLSGIAKKSIENIELAKTQSKNSVVIEKKASKFAPRGNFTRPASVRSKPAVTTTSSFPPRTTSAPKPYFLILLQSHHLMLLILLILILFF